MKTLIALLLLGSTTFAAERKVARDLPYAQPKTVRRTLDVYAPAKGKDRPVVVWIHGGAWRFGNKTSVQKKPQAFVDQGFVFVSVNYRFVPNVSVKQMAGDIAMSIKWVHDHAEEYGGDPKTIFVAGHSAGAHLAALVSTDGSYLKDAGLSLSAIKGCIPVDTAMYNIAKQMKWRASRIYVSVFGKDEKVHKALSPITHVAKAKDIPPFLILHVASRRDSTLQSAAFAKALRAAGVEAKTVPGKDKDHGSINRDLGLPSDAPTKALFEFLEAVLKKK